MAIFLYANNASTTLAGTVSAGATSCTVATGTGSLFPSPGAGEQFVLTFTDAATGDINEITYCTARSGDTMTIVRAREGTTAKTWAVGDNAANLFTRDSANALTQIAQVQAGGANYGTDTGSANAAVVTLSPAPTALVAGLTVRVKKIASQNTGAMTLNVNGLGVKSVTAPATGVLVQGQLPASGVFTVTYDGTQFQLQSGFQTQRTGEVAHYAATTPPVTALIRDGAAYNRADYPGLDGLASAAGYADPWGPGNGTTTFNVPNDLGNFDRGWDSGGAVDPGRGFGSLQTDAVGPHPHPITLTANAGNGTTVLRGVAGGVVPDGTTQNNTGTTETRPRNRAYLPIIYI